MTVKEGRCYLVLLSFKLLPKILPNYLYIFSVGNFLFCSVLHNKKNKNEKKESKEAYCLLNIICNSRSLAYKLAHTKILCTAVYQIYRTYTPQTLATIYACVSMHIPLYMYVCACVYVRACIVCVFARILFSSLKQSDEQVLEILITPRINKYSKHSG